MDVQIPFDDHISHPIDDVNITKILSITTIGGRLIHYVQLEGGKKTLMPSTLTNVLVPQLVIEFYQNKLFFVNIVNQRTRPLRKTVRRHARKSTTPALPSKLLPTNNNNNSNGANRPYGVNGNHGNITKSGPPPSKPKSLMFSLASSLAKSFNQLQGKPQVPFQPKLPQAVPVPVPVPVSVPVPAPIPQIIKTKPKPLSKQLQHQQQHKKPSNS